MLKILIVLSFICIVVFVGIAIFNNQNISYEAYNHIIAAHNKTDFKGLQTKIVSNVKNLSIEGSTQADVRWYTDYYATYISDAIDELNDGIDYYIDYLVFEEGLTKGEQDKLINLYNKYISSFKGSNKAYVSYMQAYESCLDRIQNHFGDADFAIANLRSKAVYLVKGYAGCYERGSEFFKYLVSMVNKYNLSSSGLHSYTGQSYMIKVGLVDYSLEFVYDNMDKKILEQTYVENVKNNALVDSFYDYTKNAGKYGDDDSVVNSNFKQFINNLNCLNIYEWAGNTVDYTATLSEELQAKSNYAKNFFNSNFKE